MRRTVEVTAAVVMAASVALSACSDQFPTDPVSQTSHPFFTRPPAEGFDVLRRDAPLASEVALTRVIGPEGGEIRLEEAGFALVIPPGALLKPTAITMTAPISDALAVEFAPHGLRFEVPTTLLVDPGGGAAGLELRNKLDGEQLDSFLGIYFEGDPNAGIEPLETISTYRLDGNIAFSVGHFSGYIVATG